MRRRPGLVHAVRLAATASLIGACGSASVVVAAPHLAPGTIRAVGVSSVLAPGTLRTISAYSGDLGPHGTRTVIVYTPGVTHPERLPMLYFLAGSSGNAAPLCSRAGAARLDAAFRAGARAFIVACPSGRPRRQDDTEWANSATGPDKFERFVTIWARNAVEGSDVRPATKRAIGGFSMGGFAAAALALRHPHLYRQVVSLAGYFHIDDPDHIFGTTPRTQNLHDPQRLVGNAQSQRWYLGEAAGDPYPLTARAAEAFAPTLRAHYAYPLVRRTPGTHSDAWAVAQFSAAARYLSSGWS